MKPFILAAFLLASQAASPQVAEIAEVRISSAADNSGLSGSLYRPITAEPAPGVVLLGVAGPNDRHLTYGHLVPFRALAEHLSSNGIVVLTLDDRGVGGSGGNWTEADYSIYSSDALDALRWLEAQPGVDTARTGFIGLSEGGAIAMMAAAEAPSLVDVLVLASPPGLNGEAALTAQFETTLEMSGVTGNAAETWRAAFGEFLALVRAGDETALTGFLSGPGGALVPPYGFVPSTPEAQARLFLSPWYQSQLAYDPASIEGSISASVLVIGGTLDPILPVALHHPPLREVLPGAQFVVFEGLNHLLLPAETGLPQEYLTIETSADPRVLALITDWILSRPAQ